MNRLSLYVFYEKDGNLRDSDRFYIESLRKVSDVAVIVNGLISRDGRKYLRKNGFEVFTRGNKGFDFGAWKDYFESGGERIIQKYEEIVLCNCSCYGPVFPLESVFSRMSGAECDFWGLYRHPGIPGKFPPHLQSYFLVLRSSLFRSSAFGDYIRELEPASSWSGAVELETHFTEYFENKGFASASYVSSGLSDLFHDPTIILADRLLEQGFPLVKRKVFTSDYSSHQSYTDGMCAVDVLEFLRTKTEYPLDIIKNDVIHSLPASKLRNIFHLTYVLGSEPVGSAAGNDCNGSCRPSVAAILFSCDENSVDDDLKYLLSLPEGCSLYLVVLSKELKGIWDRRLKAVGNKYEIRIQPKQLRNADAAYFLTCRDVIENFDYICLIHDNKTASACPPVKDLYFYEHCWKSVLFSRQYTENIISHFEIEPDLGLLMPAVPMFAGWPDLILNREWSANRGIASEIFKKLRLSVPFDEHPDAPFGGMFWIRGKAMEAFYRKRWSIADFSEENSKNAVSSLPKALERMYPMIAQESGFISGWVVPSSLISAYYDNLYSKATEYKAVFDECRSRPAWLNRLANDLVKGHHELVRQNDGVFFAEGYLQMYPDVAASGMDPAQHYAQYGKNEGRDNGMHPGSDLFFAEGYLQMYPDVAASGMDPWQHYVLHGKGEGRDNGLHPEKELFFAEGYLEMYPDVAASGLDPWQHYVLHGIGEGRSNGLQLSV